MNGFIASLENDKVVAVDYSELLSLIDQIHAKVVNPGKNRWKTEAMSFIRQDLPELGILFESLPARAGLHYYAFPRHLYANISEQLRSLLSMSGRGMRFTTGDSLVGLELLSIILAA